jgi:hypothetical protein
MAIKLATAVCVDCRELNTLLGQVSMPRRPNIVFPLSLPPNLAAAHAHPDRGVHSKGQNPKARR